MSISVVIVIYKNFDLIDNLLASLNNQLEFFDQLIISSDDPEHNFLEEIDKKICFFPELRKKKLSCLQNTRNIGIVKHVGEVLPKTCGNLILLIGADDYLDKKYFETVCPYFEDPRIQAVTPNQFRVNNEGEVLSASNWTQASLKKINQQIIYENFGVPPAGSLIRRNVLKQAKFADDMINEDEQFYFACNLLGQRKIIPDHLFYYRISTDSMSSWLRNPWVSNADLKLRIRNEFKNRIAQNEGWLVLLTRFPYSESDEAEKNIEKNILLYGRRLRNLESRLGFHLVILYRMKIFWAYFRFEIRKIMFRTFGSSFVDGSSE